MNKTHIEHTVVALLLQIAYGLVFHDWLTGGIFAIGLFLGREHAQREYKIGDPSKLYGYEALDYWRWSTDAKLDLACPTLAVILLYSFMNTFGDSFLPLF
jgi:hypothetical protein